MPFTEEDWCKMWESIKTIERLSDYLSLNRRDIEIKMKKEVEKIKVQIQSVIGQME
jgi:hypothetical protein